MFDLDDDFNIDDTFLDEVLKIGRTDADEKSLNKSSTSMPNVAEFQKLRTVFNTLTEKESLTDESLPSYVQKVPSVPSLILDGPLRKSISLDSQKAITPRVSLPCSADISTITSCEIPARSADVSVDSQCVTSPTVENLLRQRIPSGSPAFSAQKKLVESRQSSSSIVDNISYQRKFPGPAGLLPNTVTVPVDITPATRNEPEADEAPVLSQSINNVLESPAWKAMASEYLTDPVLESCTIAWIKGKALAQQLPNNKAPFLAAAIKTIDLSLENPYVVLQDPTGTMPGTFHYKICEYFGAYLKTGSVVVLWHAGVIGAKKTLRKYALNITMTNLICIFSNPESPQTNTPIVKRVQDIPRTKIINNVLYSRKITPVPESGLPPTSGFVGEAMGCKEMPTETQLAMPQSSDNVSLLTTSSRPDTNGNVLPYVFQSNVPRFSHSTPTRYSMNRNVSPSNATMGFSQRSPTVTRNETPTKITKCDTPDNTAARMLQNRTGSPQVSKYIPRLKQGETITNLKVPNPRLSQCDFSTKPVGTFTEIGNSQQHLENNKCFDKSDVSIPCENIVKNVGEKSAKKLSVFQVKKPRFSNLSVPSFSNVSGEPVVVPTAHIVEKENLDSASEYQAGPVEGKRDYCREASTSKCTVTPVPKLDANSIAKSLLESFDTELLFDDF